MITAVIMTPSRIKGKNGNVASIRIYAVKAANGVTGTGRNPFINQVNSELKELLEGMSITSREVAIPS